ncbi:MAG: hypothetical protein ABWY25_09375 [Paenisporosarcina sp.]
MTLVARPIGIIASHINMSGWDGSIWDTSEWDQVWFDVPKWSRGYKWSSGAKWGVRNLTYWSAGHNWSDPNSKWG